jgi:NitT/TauT family transport system permease protein/sulfonate transport system permease protein
MGFIIILGMNQSSPALIIAGMVVIAITACLISVLMDRLENLVCPWKRELPQ